MAGHELTEAPPEARQGKVIDLMSALKESLKKRGVAVNEDREEAPATAESTSSARSRKDRAERRVPVAPADS